MARTRGDADRLYIFIRHVGRRLQALDVANGISPARFSALVSLYFHGVNNLGELAAHEHVSRPAMTRLVDAMEEAGLTKRIEDTTDGRGVRVKITKKGKELVNRVRREKIELISRHLAGLDSKTARAIAVALDALEPLQHF
jgi:DNA-binding MarR family transcriptional regulator